MRSPFVRALAPSVALLAAVLLGGAARADEAVGNDEVTLKNGGSIRGTVVASEPGTRVTILELGAKEPRVIPWDQVSGVERGKFAPAPPAPAAPPAPGAPQQPALTPGTPGVVHLHVASPEPVQIYKHRESYGVTSGGNTFVIDTPRLVCAAPCDVLVDGRRGREFDVEGDGVVPSDWFRLDGLTGDQQLDVSPGSAGVHTGGMLLLGVGAAAVGVGALGAVAGAIGTSPKSNGKGFVRNDGLETAGFVVAGTGVVAIASGIVMMVTSGTSIRLHPPGAGAEVKPRYWLGEF